jgi:outer membrane protein
MKPHSIYPLILILAALLAASPVQAQQLSLHDAAARALEQNPELAMDAPGREAAKFDLTASRAGYLPRVDFEQGYTGGNNPVYVFGTLLTQHRFGAANFAIPSLNTPDPVDNLQTRLSVQQNIWDFGRTKRRVEAASLGLNMTDRDHEDHVRQVLLSTLSAYYGVSLAREGVEAARTALESAQAIQSQARQRVSAGLAVDADVLRAETFLASVRQQEIQAAGQVDIAKASLNRVMGAALGDAFGETSKLAPATFAVPPEQALIADQRKRRPDYQRLQLELRQAELEAGSRQAEFYPAVGAFAAWEADNPSLRSAGGTNWAAGVSLRWNIFAGGSDTARLQAARQRVEQKRRQLASMESAMALEIHRTVVQLRSAEQQLEVARAAEAQAQESVRILKNRYEAGLATLTDLLSAESARAGARAAFAESIYRHRLSCAQLEFSAGVLSLNSNAMQP